MAAIPAVGQKLILSAATDPLRTVTLALSIAGVLGGVIIYRCAGENLHD
jgi:hypothetical protein